MRAVRAARAGTHRRAARLAGGGAAARRGGRAGGLRGRVRPPGGAAGGRPARAAAVGTRVAGDSSRRAPGTTPAHLRLLAAAEAIVAAGGFGLLALDFGERTPFGPQRGLAAAAPGGRGAGDGGAGGRAAPPARRARLGLGGAVAARSRGFIAAAPSAPALLEGLHTQPTVGRNLGGRNAGTGAAAAAQRRRAPAASPCPVSADAHRLRLRAPARRCRRSCAAIRSAGTNRSRSPRRRASGRASWRPARRARRAGVRPGLTVSQARAVSSGLLGASKLRVIPQSASDTAAAAAALADVGYAFAPRVQSEGERLFLEVGRARAAVSRRANGRSPRRSPPRRRGWVCWCGWGSPSSTAVARVAAQAADVALVPDGPGEPGASWRRCRSDTALRRGHRRRWPPTWQSSAGALSRWGIQTLGAVAALPGGRGDGCGWGARAPGCTRWPAAGPRSRSRPGCRPTPWRKGPSSIIRSTRSSRWPSCCGACSTGRWPGWPAAGWPAPGWGCGSSWTHGASTCARCRWPRPPARPATLLQLVRLDLARRPPPAAGGGAHRAGAAGAGARQPAGSVAAGRPRARAAGRHPGPPGARWSAPRTWARPALVDSFREEAVAVAQQRSEPARRRRAEDAGPAGARPTLGLPPLPPARGRSRC